MSNNVARLEELFVELGPEALMENPEARVLIDTDPECAAIYSALGDVDTLVSQLPTPEAPTILSSFAPVKAQVEFESRPAAPASEMEWYVAVEDEQLGPLHADEVKRRIRENVIDSECLAWRAGMGDWQPIAEIAEFSSLLPSQGINNKRIQKLQTRVENHPQTKAAFTDIEWKPTAAKQLSSLVQDEIDKEDEKEKPQQDQQLQGMSDLRAVLGPRLDFVAPESSRISWSPPNPTKSFRLRPLHLILGGVGSSFVTAAAILLVLQFNNVAPPSGHGQNVPQPASEMTQSPDQPSPATRAPAAARAAPVAANAPATTSARSAKPKMSASRPARSSFRKAARKSAHIDDIFDAPAGKAAKARLSKDDIMIGVKQNARTVMPCLKMARSKGELAPGRYQLILDWTIKPDGSVTSARVTGPDSILGTSLPTCFAQKMKKWRFPSSSAGAPIRNFPFGPFTVK